MPARKLTVLTLALTVLAPLGSATAAASPGHNAGTTRALPPAASEEATPTTTPTTPQVPETPPKPSPRTKITQLPKSVVSDGTAALRVRLSGVPDPESPAPKISPSVAGTWTAHGTYEVFTPSSTLQPCSSYTLTVLAGTDATGDRPLGKARRVHLQVVCPGTLALQQALSRLGYLPYTLHSSHKANSGTGAESRALAARYAFHPPARAARRRTSPTPPASGTPTSTPPPVARSWSSRQPAICPPTASPNAPPGPRCSPP